MIDQGGTPGAGGVDLAEVARDAELLDLLAARAGVPGDEAVLGLLASFAAEVDDGLVVLLRDLDGADGLDAAEPSVTALYGLPGDGLPGDPDADPHDDQRRSRRSLGTRAGVMAVVLGATLSVSGVAAAVTGDPLSPYRGIVSAIAQATGHGDLPAEAAGVAKLNHHLAGLRAQIARGDLEGAQVTLDQLRRELSSADLTAEQRAALERRVASLEAALARAAAGAGAGHKDHKTPPGSTRSAEPKATRTTEPKATRTTEPKATRTTEPKATRTTEPKATRTTEPRGGRSAGATSVASGEDDQQLAEPITDTTTDPSTDPTTDPATDAATTGATGRGSTRGSSHESAPGRADKG